MHPPGKVIQSSLLTYNQRTGEYVLAWSDELEKQYNKIAAEAPKTSTLAKRGARDRATEGGEAKPAKKTKVEAGSSGVEDEVQLHYEKGALSKVTYPPYIYRSSIY